MSSPAPFGELIGIDYYGIKAYSCNMIKKQNPCMSFVYKTLFCGIKWQCVEYVRRWLILTHNITFQQLEMAYMMFTEPYVTFINIITEQRIPYIKYNNGVVGNLLPKPGSIIIWDKTHGYKTGHVAIVSKITNKYIYIGEQNWDDYVWNKPYSRRIPIEYTSCNSIYLNDQNEYNLPILGWITLEISIHT